MLGRDNQIFKPSEKMRDLRLLEELERNPNVSQRELSHKFGIALGVTNACLKRMARKGWIRIRGFNHRKIGYYLTHKGFSEKAELTLHLVTYILKHYSELKKIIARKLLEMQHRGIKRIVFYGISDEMEVAYITLQGVNLKLAGIVEDDEKVKPEILFGFRIEPVSCIANLKPDGILITSLAEYGEKRKRLEKILKADSVCIKDIGLP